MLIEELEKKAIEYPDIFWGEVAKDIHWFKEWETVLDTSNPPLYKWFKGGLVNICYNMLDIHVEEGRGQQKALIYDSAVTNQEKSYTFQELLDEVRYFAGALKKLNIQKGDPVIIYMPMVPEAIVAMLACARIGAIHSVVFGGFSGKELAKRIKDAKPKLIISASCGIEPKRIVEYKPLLDEAIELSPEKPEKCIILQRPQHKAQLIEGRDLEWDEALLDASPTECEHLEATDPLYILYTSGTTGTPKGVLRDHGGYAVALKWSMKNIYNCQTGDVFWAASDIGWVVGHSYICYAPLLLGCTTILYEGKPTGTPDAGAFWRVVEQHKVNCMFTAPTAVRAIRREDPKGELLPKYDRSSLKSFFLAGEHCDPKTLEWCVNKLNIPVIDHWWQTETGWPIAATCLGLGETEVRTSSAGKAVPGYNIQILDDKGNRQEAEQMGNIVVKLPLPPGNLQNLWKNETQFIQSYFSTYPGYYLTGDSGYINKDGFVYVMGRIDDIINVAGHRLSAGAMEEALLAHPDVIEGAVIAIKNRLKGHIPLAIIVLKQTADEAQTEQIKNHIIAHMRDAIGAVAAFKLIAVVDKLPKTRSGKILRSIMRRMADGEAYDMPATIEDPHTLDTVRDAFSKLGYPRDQSLDIHLEQPGG
ncbi:MAG: propionyl-CoA synthetase [Alphaproteobacteria bacterium]